MPINYLSADAETDVRELVLDLEAVELRALGENLFEQPPQSGDVPLPVAKFVDEAAYRLLSRHTAVASLVTLKVR